MRQFSHIVFAFNLFCPYLHFNLFCLECSIFANTIKIIHISFFIVMFVKNDSLQDAIKKLKKKRENFVQTAGNIIKFGSAGVTMVDYWIAITPRMRKSYVQSFLTMCDMCTFFNSSLVSDDSEKSKQLQPLVYKLDEVSSVGNKDDKMQIFNISLLTTW